MRLETPRLVLLSLTADAIDAMLAGDAARLTTLKVTEPARREAGIKVGSVDELVARLKDLGVAA